MRPLIREAPTSPSAAGRGVVTRVTRFGWEDAEKRWIAFYANRGALLNVEIGGKSYLHAYLEDKTRSAHT